MSMTLEELLAHSKRIFAGQHLMLNIWQTYAVHLYPPRADFTWTRMDGQDISGALADSYPVLMRRDLCNSYESMLRDGRDWAELDVRGGSSWTGRIWLEEARDTMMTMFYDRSSGFVRATKQGDHDFGTFGQCVLSVEPNRARDGLLVRNWHLKDCAWDEDEAGNVGQVHRKWSPTCYQLKRLYGEDKLSPQVREKLNDNKPMDEVDVRHIVMPSDMYGHDEYMQYSHVSLLVDVKNKHFIERMGLNNSYYVVPRFQTIAGSPYAYSPATVSALPNARTLQAMTHTLLEAGERLARPPLVATERVVKSSIDLGPDSITWIDKDYDEKLGDAIRPMYQDRSGFPYGQDMRLGVVEVLNRAFYLDKLNLPETNHQMTAYEVAERMKQYRRENLPLFAPMENDYNGQLCEAAFQILLDGNMLGSPYDIPPELRDQEAEFRFKSPIRALEEEKLASFFAQTSEMLAQAIEFDPDVGANINVDAAFRDAVMATGAPARWLNDMEQVTNTRTVKTAQREVQQMIENEAALPEARVA